jgi:hypothetical protein
MLADLLMWCIALAAPVALFGALCALNAIRLGDTHWPVAAAFLCIAWGWGVVLAGAVDYLAPSTPPIWPLAIAGGAALLAIGNAALYLVNRRTCGCVGCPGRRQTARKNDPWLRLLP